MLLSLTIITIIILYFIIATDFTFLIFLLLMIEPIILFKLNRNIIIKTIPNGIPIANVTNILENNAYSENYQNYYNSIDYYNNIGYYNNNYVIGQPINI